jgi:hypothetical protein
MEQTTVEIFERMGKVAITGEYRPVSSFLVEGDKKYVGMGKEAEG